MRKRLTSRLISGITALCMTFSFALAEPLHVMADVYAPRDTSVIDEDPDLQDSADEDIDGTDSTVYGAPDDR